MKSSIVNMFALCLCFQLLFLIVIPPDPVNGYAVLDIRQDEKAKLLHRLDTLNILAYVSILILIVCTIWLFKHKRVKFVHETGLAIIYGLIVGAIIRYTGKDTDISQLSVKPTNETNLNSTLKYGPPDMLWIEFQVPAGVREDVNGRFIHPVSGNSSLPIVPYSQKENESRSYAYVFQGEIYNPKTDGSVPANKKILEKATFDPEIFFNLILPLIVFNAGYSLKRKFFFRNFGAIMTYAFIGTTISVFCVALIMKTLVWFMPTMLKEFSFTDCLYFGAIISATDPVTVLAIFNDLRVDVTLHALVFGESIFNDVICIVLASSIDSFTQHYNFGFVIAMYRAFTNFLTIFVCSLLQGSLIGCATALLTKYTKLCDHPLLESTLFVLCSYASFLLSEAFELSGIVSVLFCGICQAHYTYNNLSPESRIRTKSLFEMCNFIAENFIFAYIGVSIFTFPQHLWSFWFILWTFIAIILGRALNIYPLSYFLNLGRTNKIPTEFQHVLFASGLRGAMAFALAIRNTLTEPRRLMLTSTSVVSISSVIICGSSIQPLLNYFFIPTNVDEAVDRNSTGFSANNDPNTSFNRFRNRSGSGDQIISPVDDVNIGPGGSSNANLLASNKNVYEKAWLVRKWYNFDTNFMKPLLTHARPSLMETMPTCCLPVARFLTSAQQMLGGGHGPAGDSSEHSMIITNQPSTVNGHRGGHQKILHNDEDNYDEDIGALVDDHDDDPYNDGHRRSSKTTANGSNSRFNELAPGNLVILGTPRRSNGSSSGGSSNKNSQQRLTTNTVNNSPIHNESNNSPINNINTNPFAQQQPLQFISFSTHSSPNLRRSSATFPNNSNSRNHTSPLIGFANLSSTSSSSRLYATGTKNSSAPELELQPQPSSPSTSTALTSATSVVLRPEQLLTQFDR